MKTMTCKHGITPKGKCVECVREYNIQYKEKKRISSKKYYIEHKERYLELRKKYKESGRRNQKAREWYHKNLEHIRKKQAKHQFERRHKYRKEVLEFLGNKCVRCGFSDDRALQIDHVKGGGRKSEDQRNAGSATYWKSILEKLKADSKEYQCLCCNCNMIKRRENGEDNQYTYKLRQ